MEQDMAMVALVDSGTVHRFVSAPLVAKFALLM